MIDADPNNELIVAELDGEVGGTMSSSTSPASPAGARSGCRSGGPHRLQVAAAWAGAGQEDDGVGLDRGRARELALVQLTTDKSRKDAHRFYDSLGFTASTEGYKFALSRSSY